MSKLHKRIKAKKLQAKTNRISRQLKKEKITKGQAVQQYTDYYRKIYNM